MSTLPYNYDSNPTQPREVDAVEYSCTYCSEPIKGEVLRGEFISEDAREDGEGKLIHEACVVREIEASLVSKQRFDMNRLATALRIVQDIPRETLALFDRHPLVNFCLTDLKNSVDEEMELLDPDPSPFKEELILIRNSDVVRCKAAFAIEIGRVKGDIFMLNPEAAPKAFAEKMDRLEFLKKAANGLREASHE